MTSADFEPDEPEIYDGEGDLLAPITKRIGARLIDWGLLMTVWLLLGGATSERLEDDTLVFQRWAVITWMILVIAYEVIFVAWRGQTPGKIALGIKLVALKDGMLIGLPASILRVMPVAFAIAVLGPVFPIAMVFVYFSAAFLKNSRGILDLIAGSVVVEARPPEL